MNLKRKIANEEKINVALLGATGMVGQVFAWMLSRHPWFRLSYLAASNDMGGMNYGKAVNWHLPVPLPRRAAELSIDPLPADWGLLEERDIRVVFSALPAEKAADVEPELRERGFFVFSNAGALRTRTEVPVLIPEVNVGSLELIRDQGFPAGGFVVCNANCSTTGLVLALSPLRRFGIREVTVSTYQSISGAGYPGLSALDIMNNVIPHIGNEEEKMIVETRKILGEAFPLFPRCVRVPVMFGHLETVWVEFTQAVSTGDVAAAWNTFESGAGALPSLPARPLLYEANVACPQPRHCFAGYPQGMPVWIGGLQAREGRIGFVLLVNNVIRGAAGGSIANAEAFVSIYGDE